MAYIILGGLILAIVVGAMVYAIVAMRNDGKPKKRVTAFGEVTDEDALP